ALCAVVCFVIRNRLPSAATSKLLAYGPSNSILGVPARNAGEVWMSTAMTLFPLRYNNSRPLRFQRATAPPSFETCDFPPGPGHGTTYTSFCPDSLEVYATQRPSGENWACHSLNCESRSACGLESEPARGNTHTSCG